MGFLNLPGHHEGIGDPATPEEDEEKFIMVHDNRLYVADGVSILTIILSATYAALVDVRFLFVTVPVATLYTLTRS